MTSQPFQPLKSLVIPLIFIFPIFMLVGEWGTSYLVQQVAALETTQNVEVIESNSTPRLKRVQVQEQRIQQVAPDAQFRLQASPEAVGEVARERTRVLVRDGNEQTRSAGDQVGDAREHVLVVHTRRLNQRYQLYFMRFSRLMAKVQTRLDKMEAAGYDTEAAQAKLNQASMALDAAQDKADEVLEQFSAVDPENYPTQRTQALAARDAAQEVHLLYREVQRLLVETIQLMKESLEGALETQDSSNS
jgi:hypothetical protein